ncbi:458_t:CDS:1, partial [Entrophospora sp. SA101]
EVDALSKEWQSINRKISKEVAKTFLEFNARARSLKFDVLKF